MSAILTHTHIHIGVLERNLSYILTTMTQRQWSAKLTLAFLKLFVRVLQLYANQAAFVRATTGSRNRQATILIEKKLYNAGIAFSATHGSQTGASLCEVQFALHSTHGAFLRHQGFFAEAHTVLTLAYGLIHACGEPQQNTERKKTTSSHAFATASLLLQLTACANNLSQSEEDSEKTRIGCVAAFEITEVHTKTSVQLASGVQELRWLQLQCELMLQHALLVTHATDVPVSKGYGFSDRLDLLNRYLNTHKKLVTQCSVALAQTATEATELQSSGGHSLCATKAHMERRQVLLRMLRFGYNQVGMLIDLRVREHWRDVQRVLSGVPEGKS
jgi:hypothetical protein